jgi:hypothetical protein
VGSLLTEAEDPLLETAPKLFSLPVKVFTGLHRPKKVLDRSIGFAYAGSSLASAATFSFSATACQSLLLKSGGIFPSLADIAALVQRVAEHYVGEIWQRFYPKQNRGKAAFFIFGFCPSTEKLRAFEITPTITEQFSMTLCELAITDGSLFCLGDAGAIDGFLRLFRMDELKEPQQRQSPSGILKQLISMRQHSAIGGVVQTMYAGKLGARAIPSLEPVSERKANLMFLNIALDRLLPVGDCSIGIEAGGPEWRDLKLSDEDRRKIAQSLAKKNRKGSLDRK